MKIINTCVNSLSHSYVLRVDVFYNSRLPEKSVMAAVLSVNCSLVYFRRVLVFQRNQHGAAKVHRSLTVEASGC